MASAVPHRRKGTFMMRWTITDPSTGKLIKKSKLFDGPGGERAAKAEANRLEATERAHGAATAPKTLTFAAYVKDRYMPHCEAHTAASTVRGNRQRLDKAVAIIGDIPLRDVDGVAIDLMTAKLKSAGLAPLMVRHCYDAVRTALRQARRWKLIVGTPWLDAKRPSAPRKRAKVAPLEESYRLSALLRANGRIVAATYVETIADCGGRPGEILALMWDAVDLDRGVIHIWRALERYDRSQYRLKEWPKNEGSIRTIALATKTVEALRELKVWHAENHLKSGGAWPKDGLLFPSNTGELWPVHAAAALINKWARKIGVTSGSYSRRHGMASELLAGGVPVTVVSQRMGHASTKMTLDTYAHVLPDHADAAVDFLNRRNAAPEQGKNKA
ncbi:integrase [Ensifer sp. WSM1721]|uniref:tyrosine-type recombinase/integrase n=1 Tax=Ensifer sp. WSM1721 TaxID=1041159 RepID=UPI00047DE183|nr:site-specific integrase [Ensifer sp. WSM1721]